MKNVYMTVLLCATGLVTMSGAFAATATEDQWRRSVTSYPERRPEFNIKNYHASSCKPISAEGGSTDYLFSSAYKKAWPCNTIDKGSCAYRDIVAHAGEVIGGDTSERRVDHSNRKWRCVTDIYGAGLYWYDAWWAHDKIPDCVNDDYRIFKNKDNTVSYLFDSTISDDTLYHAIAKPSDVVCVTYACAPEYRPSFDVSTASNPASVQCIGQNKACPLYNDITRGRTISSNEYTNVRKQASCTNAAYFSHATMDASKPIVTHGTNYIDDLKKYMNEQLKNNFDDAKYVYSRKSDNDVFKCTGSVCTLLNGVLDPAKTNCDYLCTEGGFAVRLTSDDNNPCPDYFKYVYNDTKQMYVCDFDVAAIKGAKETAAKNAKDACQNAFCEATGGKMNESGACMCGKDPCNTKYTSNGNTYNYCGPKSDGLGGTVYCNPAEGLYWGYTTTEIENAVNNMDATFKKVCSTSNAMSDANGPKTDIPTLVANLSKIESEFGLSKWRTAEGKFNYARLASDATAGIVLGTTGALVTAHVVKKKQVEDGFESLECTVGGQHVGDWGDVFRIDGK